MQRQLFTYSGSQTGVPFLWERSGQLVEIVRELSSEEVDEEVGAMFQIRFDDGKMAHAYADELTEPSRN